jgi:putative membrane protein
MEHILQFLATAAALWVAVYYVPGLTFRGDWLHFFGVAAVFGVLNTVVRPILKLFALPLVILTLGLFIFVINGLMIWLTSAVSTSLGLGFHVAGFMPAILGALVVSVVSMILHVFVR